MSVEAITWAFAQPVTPSSTKFVLVALANCASGDLMLAHPSIAYLSTVTGQDRKTVMAALGRLRDAGLIEDSGHRRGESQRVVVYRLLLGRDGAESGTQKRDRPKNGTVPKFPTDSTEIPQKTGDSCPRQSQKRDTEPSVISNSKSKSKNNSTRDAVALPEWLDAKAWGDWVAYRRSIRKPLSDRAVELSIAKLDEFRKQGHEPAAVIDNAILQGWQGLYPPKTQPSFGKPSSGRPSAADSFHGKTYTGDSDDQLPDFLRPTPEPAA